MNDIDTMAIYPESMPMSTTLFDYKNGAISIFYPEVCKKISEKWNDDFYIAFISADCAILHKFGTIDFLSIKRHLKATNNAFSEDDFLTNNVYYYDRKTDKIDMVKSERYKHFESLVKDIVNADCDNFYDLRFEYQVSEKCFDHAMNYIENGKLENDHCYTKLVEELIKIENGVKTI